MAIEIINGKVFEKTEVELTVNDLNRIKGIYNNRIAEIDAKIVELQAEKLQLQAEKKVYTDAKTAVSPR